MPISRTLQGVLIGGIFTLAGSISVGAFHYFRTKTEVRAENTRLRAELYLEKKVEALTHLHAKVEESQREFSTDIKNPSADRDLVGLIEDFEIAMDRSSIYLSEDQYDIVYEYFNTLRSTNSYIQGWGLEPDHMNDLDEFEDKYNELVDSYQDVKDLLQDEVREPLETLEE